jgi:SdpI/YhfL family protein
VHLLGLLPIVVGLGLAVPGWFGLRDRLPRNRFAGVRTPATLRTDETFRVANRVAGLPMVVAGLIGLVTGAVAFVVPAGAAVVTTVVVGGAGLLAIAIAGGVLGHKAAAAVPEPVPAGCAGCACGGGGCSVRANVSGVGGE